MATCKIWIVYFSAMRIRRNSSGKPSAWNPIDPSLRSPGALLQIWVPFRNEVSEPSWEITSISFHSPTAWRASSRASGLSSITTSAIPPLDLMEANSMNFPSFWNERRDSNSRVENHSEDWSVVTQCVLQPGHARQTSWIFEKIDLTRSERRMIAAFLSDWGSRSRPVSIELRMPNSTFSDDR